MKKTIFASTKLACTFRFLKQGMQPLAIQNNIEQIKAIGNTIAAI